MEDGERGRDGPGIDQFAAMANRGIGKDAVGAASDPFFNVVAHAMPVEAEPDSVEGFESHKMATGRAGVEGLEDAVAEGYGGDNEEETAAGQAKWLRVDEAVFVNADEAVAKGVAVAGGKGTEDSFGKGVGRVGGKGGENGLEDGIRCVAGLPFGG